MGHILDNLLLQGADAISHNARIKSYPDGSIDMLLCDRAVFRAPGWESRHERDPPRSKAARQERPLPDDWMDNTPYLTGDPIGYAEEQRNRERAQRRARARIREIALCNPFQLFVTLTVDKQRCDRYEISSIWKTMRPWLSNQVQRRGLRYVLVPERHKDGAIHFHGLFNDVLPMSDSGTLTGGALPKPRRPRSAKQREAWLAGGAHEVYNLDSWPLGFTTAIRLYGEYDAAVGYVCKYIGKQGEKPGGRWYYSGGALVEPSVEYVDISPDDFPNSGSPGFQYEFDVPEAHAHFVQLHFPGRSDS